MEESRVGRGGRRKGELVGEGRVERRAEGRG